MYKDEDGKVYTEEDLFKEQQKILKLRKLKMGKNMQFLI